MLFLTVTPSSSPTNKPNATPFIGQPGQSIIVSNTYFNPVTIEIDIVEYDTSSLAIALFGNQTKSIDDGIYTMYDENNNIYKQYNCSKFVTNLTRFFLRFVRIEVQILILLKTLHQ